jgi:DNA-binding CsgD family transcriptional regulator
MAPPGLRLSIQQVPIELETEQVLNLVSGSLHSTSTIAYHLSIALLTVHRHKMGVTRINRKVGLNATRVLTSSYRLNAQSKYRTKSKGLKLKDKEHG